MDQIDLTVIDEQVWHILLEMKTLSAMPFDKDNVKRVLRQYLALPTEVKKHIPYPKSLVLAYVYYVLSVIKSARYDLLPIVFCEQLGGSNLGGFYIKSNGYLWVNEVPDYYREQNRHWFWAWLYGVGIMRAYAKMKTLHAYFWLGQAILKQDVVFLLAAYDVFLSLKDRLKNRIDALLATTYFWQFGVHTVLSACLTGLDRYHQFVLNHIKQYYRFEKNAQEVALVLTIDSKNQRLVDQLFSRKEQIVMMFLWRLHQPFWQRLMDDPSSDDWVSYYVYLIKRADHVCYQQLQVIDWFSRVSNHKILLICFENTIREHPDFWWLWYWRGQDPFRTRVKTLLDQWYLPKQAILKDEGIRGDVDKLHPQCFSEVLLRYQYCLDKQQVRQVKYKLSSLSWLALTRLPLSVVKTATVLWQSVSMLVCVPKTCTTAYLEALGECFSLHVILHEDLRRDLQSYMAVLAKYAWRRMWQPEFVVDAALASELYGGDVWQMSMQALVLELKQQESKGVKRDVSVVG